MSIEQTLVADIGGTNARFALARDDNRDVGLDAIQTLRAEDFESVCDAADAYLKAVGTKPKAACFAVAGPVGDEAIPLTNSPWVVRREEIKSALGLRRLIVVNDFEALASGVRHLDDQDLVLIKAGNGAPDAPRLVIGPGTGLGQALIVPCGGRDKIVPTEGGHVAFAPRTKAEVEIMQFIAREHARVSVERLLSGDGLVDIFRALCGRAGAPREHARADEITVAAKAKTDPVAVETVETFCAILGAVAGDAVLATGARSGVVLGGGILPKIREALGQSPFIDGFVDKGRMRPYVEDIPVHLIVVDTAALTGAATILREAH